MINIFKVYRNGIWKYESKLNFVDKKLKKQQQQQKYL